MIRPRALKTSDGPIITTVEWTENGNVVVQQASYRTDDRNCGRCTSVYRDAFDANGASISDTTYATVIILPHRPNTDHCQFRLQLFCRFSADLLDQHH